MRTFNQLIICTLIALTLNAQAEIVFSDAKIKLEEIVYGGTGCPHTEGQAIAVTNDFLILNHPSFKLGKVDGHLMRKACSVRIPITVKKGYRVALIAESIGKINVSSSEDLTLKRELFFVGDTSPIEELNFTDTRLDNFVFENKNEVTYSKCGENVVLAMNISAILKRDFSFQKSKSLQLSKTYFQIVTQKCN